MTNLITLISNENFRRLFDSARNTHVVIEKENQFICVKKTFEINYSKVVGIGSRQNCKKLVNYLSNP